MKVANYPLCILSALIPLIALTIDWYWPGVLPQDGSKPIPLFCDEHYCLVEIGDLLREEKWLEARNSISDLFNEIILVFPRYEVIPLYTILNFRIQKAIQ